MDISAQMLDTFESTCRLYPERPFLTFKGNSKHDTYTYRQARLISAALARQLLSRGLRKGDAIMCELPNIAESVFLILACAYAGFAPVVMEEGLSEGEWTRTRLSAERDGLKVGATIRREHLVRMLMGIKGKGQDESELVREVYGPTRQRSIMGEDQDAIDDTVHFAERAAHLFDIDAKPGVIFTSAAVDEDGLQDPRKKQRAVPLTWMHLSEASQIADAFFEDVGKHLWQDRFTFSKDFPSGTTSGSGSLIEERLHWQCVLPLSGIAGFQVLVRTIVGRTHVLLYEVFDPETILQDAASGHVTHLSLTDNMLQDLLTIEEWRQDAGPYQRSRLCSYQCILVTGRRVIPHVTERAMEMGARVFAGYGTVETSGMIAGAQILPSNLNGLEPLSGYEVRIVDPDEEGFGRIAVKGPGVFDGYLSGNTAFTVDHFFITEDKGAYVDGRIYVKNRTENMFSCAGQNVYPQEIADVLRHVPGVSAVHVFGIPDVRFGMLPIAAVERTDSQLSAEKVQETMRHWYSSINGMLGIYVFDQLPRCDDGRLDRRLIESSFALPAYA